MKCSAWMDKWRCFAYFLFRLAAAALLYLLYTHTDGHFVAGIDGGNGIYDYTNEMSSADSKFQ
jgi:hypothetical protein